MISPLAPRELLRHIIVGLKGTELTPSERHILSSDPPAGVILFARNAADSAQLKRLTSEVADIIGSASGGLAPLVMADHEGGRTSALASAIGTPPSQMAAWSAGDPAVLEGVFRETALRMLSCGINMTLSPVADVNSEYLNPVIGTRAFSEKLPPAAKAVAVAVRALRSEGILCCIKHFPGHGSTRGDSHLQLPVAGMTTEMLRESELPAFAEGIAGGADAVMTAHVAPADRGGPASLDPAITAGILRGEMGFGGAIITDGLEMEGILTGKGLAGAAAKLAAEGSVRPAAVMRSALEAGNDILLFTRPVEEVYAEIAAVFDDLESDIGFWKGPFLEISRLSAPRVESLRARAGKARAASLTLDDAAYQAAADNAVRIERDPGGRLPLPKGPIRPVFCGERSDFSYHAVRRFISDFLKSGVAGPGGAGKASWSEERLRAAAEASISCSHDRAEVCLYAPLGGPEGDEGILVLLLRRPLEPSHLARLSERYPVIVAAERPWDAKFLPPEKTVITTLGTYCCAARRVAGLLEGKAG